MACGPLPRATIGVGMVIADHPLHADGRDVVKPVSCFVTAPVLVDWVLDAADLVEKSEAEGRKLRSASNFSRSLIDGGRVRFGVSASSRSPPTPTLSSHHPFSGKHG